MRKSKGEPVRRLEIFTGSGRRRAWTPEQKAAILAESYESGDKVSAVAGRYGLTPQQLFGWRRDAQRRSTRRQSNDAAEMSFAPVLVETGGPHAGPPVAQSSNGDRDDRDRARRGRGARWTWNRSGDADEGAAGGEGRDVISVPAGVRVLVATKPVDFGVALTAWRRWRRTSFSAIRILGRSSSFARSGRTG